MIQPCCLSDPTLLGQFAARIAVISIFFVAIAGIAQENGAAVQFDEQTVDFTAPEWSELEESIDRGLAWLAKEQSGSGSIGLDSPNAQPALTSLAAMAFLSRGHQPGAGPYGVLLNRAIDYVLSTQDSLGIFVEGQNYGNNGGSYSHAISGVMLAEVLGMADQEHNERIDNALRRALNATVKLQQRHHDNKRDRGGWRYLKYDRNDPDSDLSVTTWHLLFLRAARNAGYAVPESLVADASDFVRRCHLRSEDRFTYLPGRRNGTITMTGAGVLCLSLAGQMDDPDFKSGAETLRRYDFTNLVGKVRWPYYTCYHCSQAASQAGGEVRRTVLKGIAGYLLPKQYPSGFWPPVGNAKWAGDSYATSMAILSLTPAYQILPIYQQ